jgi:4,5-DOPA dioxygenase extradiol
MSKMPIIFIGHGSPMNAIEDNIYTESWRNIWKNLEKPRAILMLSAHWITERETRISTQEKAEMIYDMGGFPPELYKVRYNAPGSIEIAEEIFSVLNNPKISLDPKRGYDHWVWSTLIHIFPAADIPVIMMSLDYRSTPASLVTLGEQLKSLRSRWILIIGSWNIVHNLGAIDWSGNNTYQWATEFDTKVANLIEIRNYTEICNWKVWWEISRLAHPSYDHLLPLFPLLGASSPDDKIDFFTPDIVMGSLSMRSILWR